MGILRIFLALSVLMHHVPNHKIAFLHAGVAVTAFFIISGFYMTLVINEYSAPKVNWLDC